MRNTIANIHVRRALVGVLTALLLQLIGCGGGAKSGKLTSKRGRGTAEFTIKWPQITKSTRLVPAASTVIRVTLKENSASASAYSTFQDAVRPYPPPSDQNYTTTLKFTEVPPGDFVATASAYPSYQSPPAPPLTPTTPIQATASIPVTIADNVTKTINLTMGTTITHLRVTDSNNNVIPAALTRLRNEKITLMVQALDANNATVITGAFAFSSDTSTVADFTPNTSQVGFKGTLGKANITVKETESNVQSQFALTYKAAILIADSLNKRIVQLDDIGDSGFVSFDTTSDGGAPTGVAMDSKNNIYYTAGDHLYQISSISAASKSSVMDSLGTSTLSKPTGIFIDANDVIYIADTGHNRVVSINKMADMTVSGSFTNKLNNDLLASPQGVTVVGTTIYIADTGKKRIVQTTALSDVAASAPTVHIYNPTTPDPPPSMTSSPVLSKPTNLVYDGTNLVITDNGSGLVRQFPLSAFTTTPNPLPTDSSIGFTLPYGIAIETLTTPTHYYVTESSDETAMPPIRGNAVDRFDGITGTNLIKYGGTSKFSGASGIFVR